MSHIIASNGYINISYIDYGIDDYVVLSDDTRCMIHYDEDVAYFYYNNVKHNLGEFIRV